MNCEDFVQEMQDAVERWLSYHNTREGWAEAWHCDEPIYTFSQESVIKNNWFTIDWRNYVIDLMVENRTWWRCGCCGSIYESGDNCGCEKNGEEEIELTNEDADEIGEKIDELYADNTDLAAYAGKSVLIEALETKGYDSFREQMRGTIDPVIDEFKSALDRFEDARTNAELFAAALWAVHLAHVSGEITSGGYITEYCNEIISIRDDGPLSIFTQEEMDEYIQEKAYAYSQMSVL